nr:uncharacterized protein LOC128693220 isoform X3 [Cherax quadricarinatus]
MEYDMILPVVAGASGVFAGCAVLYSKIRQRFPVRVNCWFCNTDTKVEYRHQESWICPSCQQYNGFNEDGSYNRDIPAQYCENLNTPLIQQKKKLDQTGLALGNGLCHTCNLNQTLKIRALADYTPIHPDNYDKEIEDYRKRLERTYSLCRQCEATLHQTLGKQDSWLKPKLISWRLHFTSENKTKCFNVSDSVASFVWVGLLALCSSRQLLSAKDYNSLQVLISGAAVLFTVWTSLVQRNFSRTGINKKTEINKSMTSDNSSDNLEESQCTLNASLSDDLGNLTPPFSHPNNGTINHMHSGLDDPIMADCLDTTLSSLKISTPLKNHSQNRTNAPFSPKLLFSEKPGCNPKLNDTYCSQKDVNSPSRFSAKNITQSSWVAGGYWGHPTSPSREYSQQVMPALGSMCPGQSPMFPLSRSSSQSSGFVSQNSGLPPYKIQGPFSLPNSCHGSHYGDLDRGSLLSEPTYKSWGYAPSLYPSDSASQISCSQSRVQAKSLYSCASHVSDGSLQRNPPSPPASTSCFYHTTRGNLSENSSNTSSSRNVKIQTADITAMELKNIAKPYTSLNYRNPWIAFFLGMSIAANGFLVAMLYMHTDIKSFFTS